MAMILQVILLVVTGLVVFAQRGDLVNISDIVECKTNNGQHFAIAMYRDWAPIGTDHFVDLVRAGFFTDMPVFRAVRGFVAQFGISVKPEFQHFHEKTIKDDVMLNKPVGAHTIAFAGDGPNSRSTQVIITFAEQESLGRESWETPFGALIHAHGFKSIYTGYSDIPPFGNGPDPQEIFKSGDAYLKYKFPLLDYISCHVVDKTIKPGMTLDPRNMKR